jgi:hypothetical protein
MVTCTLFRHLNSKFFWPVDPLFLNLSKKFPLTLAVTDTFRECDEISCEKNHKVTELNTEKARRPNKQSHHFIIQSQGRIPVHFKCIYHLYNTTQTEISVLLPSYLNNRSYSYTSTVPVYGKPVIPI